MNLAKGKMTVSVVGLGKLGLPLALCFAAKKFTVVGYDVSPQWRDKIRSGTSPIVEPNSQSYLSKYGSRIAIVDDPNEIAARSDITFIVVPTPSNKNGSFSLRYLEQVIRTLSASIKTKKQKHTFVITSTVSPGSIENIIAPLLSSLSGKQIGKTVGLCYSPELIALGSVIKNIQKPDFLFIGQSDPESGKLVEKVRIAICENKPKTIHTSWINIELAKLCLNAYITSKINFANMVARLSERTRGADSAIILDTIGHDSRIGTKYLKGGLGYGGPCFPRDNLALQAAIDASGLDVDLPKMTHRFNQQQIRMLTDYILQLKGTRQITVGVLGLSYKPDTDVTTQSQGMLLIRALIKKKVPTKAHDPLALPNAIRELPSISVANTIRECIRESKIVVITTAWKEYLSIDWNLYSGKTIIDCWGVIPQGSIPKQNTLITLGKDLKLS